VHRVTANGRGGPVRIVPADGWRGSGMIARRDRCARRPVRPVGAELFIHGGDLRIRTRWRSGVIVGRGGTTVVSDLPTGHGLARTVGSQRRIEKCGDPRAASRACRVAPPDEQAATVLGRPRGVRGTDPVAVPGLSIASDRHPGHDLAVAPGLGEATLMGLHQPVGRCGKVVSAAAGG
jgi:hypothetical protein